VYQLATTELALQKITAAPAGNVTLNNFQLRHCSPLRASRQRAADST
jgi:hypothetical protein